MNVVNYFKYIFKKECQYNFVQFPLFVIKFAVLLIIKRTMEFFFNFHMRVQLYALTHMNNQDEMI